MSKEEDNKAVVVRWFTEFWGKDVNLAVIDEIAAPDMLLQYSLHEPRRGREDITAFMTDFRAAFPDLNFWGTADLIAEGDYRPVGRRRHPYGSGYRRPPARRRTGGDRPQDALYRQDRAEAGRRHDRRRAWFRRRPDRNDAARADPESLIENHIAPVCVSCASWPRELRLAQLPVRASIACFTTPLNAAHVLWPNLPKVVFQHGIKTLFPLSARALEVRRKHDALSIARASFGWVLFDSRARIGV